MALKFDKKFITIGLILGGMSAVAAGILGGVNLLTKKTIEDNDKKTSDVALNKVLEKVFSDATSHSDDPKKINSEEYNYVLKEYEAYREDKSVLGYVYYTSGKNAYGSISLMVGIRDERIANYVVVTNTQSYATTLEENYIGKFLADPDNVDFDSIDTHCGATYGATLVKNMCDQALSYSKSVTKGGE